MVIVTGWVCVGGECITVIELFLPFLLIWNRLVAAGDAASTAVANAAAADNLSSTPCDPRGRSLFVVLANVHYCSNPLY